MAKFLSVAPSFVVTSAIVRGELQYGAMKSSQRRHNLVVFENFFLQVRSLPFDDAAADEYGRIRAHLAARGTPIGGNDMMIAAIAIVNDLTLVTANTREFSRVPRLRLENWES